MSTWLQSLDYLICCSLLTKCLWCKAQPWSLLQEAACAGPYSSGKYTSEVLFLKILVLKPGISGLFASEECGSGMACFPCPAQENCQQGVWPDLVALMRKDHQSAKLQRSLKTFVIQENCIIVPYLGWKGKKRHHIGLIIVLFLTMCKSPKVLFFTPKERILFTFYVISIHIAFMGAKEKAIKVWFPPWTWIKDISRKEKEKRI